MNDTFIVKVELYTFKRSGGGDKSLLPIQHKNYSRENYLDFNDLPVKPAKV